MTIVLGGIRLFKRKEIHSKWAGFMLVVVLLPFISALVSGKMVWAEDTSNPGKEVKLFDTNHGKGNISYQVDQTSIKWTVELEQKATEKENQFQLELKQGEQSLEIENLNVQNNAQPYVFDSKIKEVTEKSASKENRKNVLTFETAKVGQVTLTPKILEKNESNEPINLLANQAPINLTIDRSSETSSDGSESSSTLLTTTTAPESTVSTTAESGESTSPTHSSSDKVDLGDADEATFESAKKEAEKRQSETGAAQEITRSASVVPKNSELLPSENELLIDSNAINSLSDFTITVSGTSDYTPYKKGPKSPSGGLNNITDLKNNVYVLYGQKDMSARAILFNNVEAAKKATVTVNYPFVGTYQGKAVGAILTIKNIKPSSKKSFTNWDTPLLDFASSLYSGMVYDHINGLTATFTFIDPETKQQIENINDSYLTFASLNNATDAKSEIGGNSGFGSEFVFKNDDKKNQKGLTTADTALDLGIPEKGSNEKITSPYPYGNQPAYFGKRAFNDKLGETGYEKSAVMFSINGTPTGNATDFTFGSLANRAYISFNGAVITKVQPKPIKTVSDQEGYDGRLNNSRDAYAESSDTKLTDLSNFVNYNHVFSDYRQTKEVKNLAAALDISAKDKQKIYYYHISQKIAQLGVDTIVNRLPSSIELQDDLPPGTQLASGQPINIYFAGKNIGTRVLSAATTQIDIPLNADELAKLELNGQDLVFEIPFVVEKKALDRVGTVVENRQFLKRDTTVKDPFTSRNNLQEQGIYKFENQAVVVMDSSIKATNPVMNRVVRSFNLQLLKTDESGRKVNGATFELSGGDLVKPLSVTTDDGLMSFKNANLHSGQHYTLKELLAPYGYIQSDKTWDISISDSMSNGITVPVATIKASNDANPTELVLNADGVTFEANGDYKIVNKKKDFTINLEKTDANNADKKLDGAVFELSSDEGVLAKLTSKDGSVKFDNLDFNKKYTVTEIEAPEGYNKLNQPIVITPNSDHTFTVSIDGKNPNTIKPIDANNTLTLSFNVPNKAKVPLPATGGSGTESFYLLGTVALVIVGSYVIYRRTRKEVA